MSSNLNPVVESNAHLGIPSFDLESTAPPDDPAPPPYEAVVDDSTIALAPTASVRMPVPEPWTGLPNENGQPPALHLVPPQPATSPSSPSRHSGGTYTPSPSSGASPITPTSASSIFHLHRPDDASSSSGHSVVRSSSASSSSHSRSLSSAAHALSQSPHPSFDRRPPSHVSYGSFPPATHYAHADDLMRGFPLSPPTCACAPAPHPFVTHDVNEADWAQFLDDVKGAGGLKPVNALLADMAPTAVMTGLIGGYFAGKALKAHVKSKRKSPVAEVIELWNRRFFHPRCMDVVLAQGMMTYTGPVDAMPPDRVRPTAARKKDKHVKVFEDHSDDEGSGSSRLDAVGAAMGSVGEQFGRRGTVQRGRREFGLDLKHSARERWRVVITYKPPVL